MDEIGFPQPQPKMLFADNNSMLTLAKNYSGNHKRIRHSVTKLNFLIQKVEDVIIDIVHLAGTEMPANVFTKHAVHNKHATHIP